MLPSLTAVARRRPPRRAVLGAVGALLLTASLITSVHAQPAAVGDVPGTMADSLAPGTWAFSIPSGWFTAPIAGLRAVASRVLVAPRWGCKSAQQVLRIPRGDEVWVGAADPRTVGAAVAV